MFKNIDHKSIKMFTAPTASAHTVPLAKLYLIKSDPSCILLAPQSSALRRGA